MTTGAAPAAAQSASEVYGDWYGALNTGAVSIRLGFHLGETSTFDDLDRGVRGLPATVAREGSLVRIGITGIAAFEGELSEDGLRLTGTFRQGLASLPLVLERGEEAVLRRPQTPVPPFPYRVEEVEYDNPLAPGVHLAGTLTLPPATSRVPAVLLITGSGRQDRDETMFEHKPFLVLADALTRRGVAVLRVDDRGVGGSTGAGLTDASADFAGDVAAGVAWLRSRPEIDPDRIGLIGHSEGGLIAPMVAVADPRIAFLVLWAGPAVSGLETVVDQVRLLNLAAGAPPAIAEANAGLQRRVLEAVISGTDTEATRAAVNRVMAEAGAPPVNGAVFQQLTSAWYRAFLTVDPLVNLRQLHVPVLALFGSRDAQVGSELNAPIMREGLVANPGAVVEVLPGLNHLFQTAVTGSVDEYVQIEETIAPSALDRMVDWVVQAAGL
ncbi:MAG: alpha/beta fold hydrolase [Gemmatimonadota bacterium]|jgi:pimeloyl-ACP methyl ester carboxylesterase|nr:alpha/beta fold hydrolase [Gemmatimonadota bacterium]